MHNALKLAILLPALAGSATALAQTQTPRPGNQPPQPSQPPVTTPRTPDSTTDRVPTTDRPTDRANRSDAPAALTHLEGVWRVDVKVNPRLFKGDKDKMGGHSKDSKDWNKQPGDNSKDWNKEPGDRQPGSATDPRQPDPRTADPKQPSAPGTDANRQNPTDASARTGGVHSCTGYAVSDLIMGDRILRQTFASNDMTNFDGSAGKMTTPSTTGSGTTNATPGTTGSGASNQTPGTTGTSGTTGAARPSGAESRLTMDSGAFRGLSFISFNAGSGTYDAVFMDSHSGEICTRTGTYDATSNRITFQGSKDEASKAKGSTGADRKMDMPRDVRVVVEILGHDQHRVTMYQGDATSSDNIANMDIAAPNSNVVYTATYTRASSTEGTDIRRNLWEQERNSSTPRDGKMITPNSPERKDAPPR